MKNGLENVLMNFPNRFACILRKSDKVKKKIEKNDRI